MPGCKASFSQLPLEQYLLPIANRGAYPRRSSCCVLLIQMSASFVDSKSKDKESKRHSRHASDYESLQDAREKDSNRRSSFHASAQQPMVPFPGSTGYPPAGAPAQGPGQYPAFGGYPQAHGPGAYPTQPYAAFPGGDPNQQQQAYGNPYGTTATGYPDLNRQMGELDLGRSRDGDRDKKASRSRRQSTVETARPPPETLYGGYPTFGATNAAPPGAVTGGAGIYGYPGPPSVGGSGSTHSSTRPSPNVQPRDIPQYGYPVPYAASSHSTNSHEDRDGNRRKRANSTAHPPAAAGGNVYPPGHILEGQPKPPGMNDGPPPRSMSRAASPNPYNTPSHLPARPKSQMGRPSPNPSLNHAVASQLAAPESFSRTINATLPYVGFKPLKITNMDTFFSHMPKMPQELQTHDVRNEDWFRLSEVGRMFPFHQLHLISAGSSTGPHTGLDGENARQRYFPSRPSTSQALRHRCGAHSHLEHCIL